jgi:hypothetical protein
VRLTVVPVGALAERPVGVAAMLGWLVGGGGDELPPEQAIKKAAAKATAKHNRREFIRILIEIRRVQCP